MTYMTYNVFGGTLNLAQSDLAVSCWRLMVLYKSVLIHGFIDLWIDSLIH